MHVIVDQSQLLKALSHSARVVERRNAGEIVSNVFLDAFAGGLRLKATDLDLLLTEVIPAVSKEDGKTTVSAQLFSEIVKKLSDYEQVELCLDQDKKFLIIKSGVSQFKLAVMDANDFPVEEEKIFTHNFCLPASELFFLLSRCEFAISMEDTRYYLTGAYFHCVEEDNKKLLRSVATDGHRLARIQIDAPEGVENMPNVIIGRKLVTELCKILAEDKEQQVNISLSDRNIKLQINDICFVSSLVDGKFPDYNRVIPIKNDKELKISNSALKSAVDRVTVVSERGKAVKFSLTQDKLILSVSASPAGSAEERLDVDYKDEDLQIGFNARYLIDIISQINSEDIYIRLLNSESPAVVKSPEDDRAIYILMPMRC
ncbi:DNA polymerase III subunit beta [Bartonella sp. DGB1]|uniref:DNA polymerase III subunit beta n=1 Tax=Bartonella sp. DGB1 TaxID=3239807 RepID=UPI0035235476